jgi:hypothetical protein
MLAVSIAFVLYWLFFGITATRLSNGGTRQQVDVSDESNAVKNMIQGLEDWEGLLFFTARQMENSIGAFYYKYCYLPSVYNTAYLDMELGARVNGVSSMSNLNYRSMVSSGAIDPSHDISLPMTSYSVEY